MDAAVASLTSFLGGAMLALMNTPLMRVAREVVRSWQFWVLLALLLASGFALQFSGQGTHSLVCDWYHQVAETRVKRGIDEVLGTGMTGTLRSPTTQNTATTLPVGSSTLRDSMLRHIENYFCVQPTTRPLSTPHRLMSVAGLVVPGAIILAFIITSLLPIAPDRAGVTQRVNASMDTIAAEDRVIGASRLRTSLGATNPLPTQMAAGYLNSSVAARQLRVCVTYAVFSSLATFLCPPDYIGSPQQYLPDVATAHFAAITVAAVAAAAYGVVLFARSNLSTLKLAWRLGFGPVFFGGVISAAISLPYQIVRPDELRPMPRGQVISVLVTRCILLPLIGTVFVPLLRPILRLPLFGTDDFGPAVRHPGAN